MSEVAQLEKQLEELKTYVDRKEQVLKLSSNTSFKKVILESFCKEECSRYAQASADPNLTPEQRTDALNLAQAAGHLKRFLSISIQMGHQAENEIKDVEAALEELRAEEV